MNVVALITGWLVLAATIGASGSLLDDSAAVDASDVGGNVKVVVDDILTKELSVSNVVRPSSHCWMSSIATIHRFNAEANSPFTSGSTYCAAMTEEQLDVLALELAHCELIKARRDMFIHQSHEDDTIASSSQDTQHECPLGSSDQYHPYHASSCLELLTDHAHSIYHQIRLHTKSLCNQLADEMFQRQKEETTQLLALQIQAVLQGTTSTIEQLHFQSALLQNHSHLLKEHQMDLEQMYETRKREEVSQTLLMKEHQQELDRMYEARKREQAEEDRLRKLREDSTMNLLRQQTTWMKSQQMDFQDMLKAKEELLEEKVKERMRELSQMQEMIATAQSQIRPLSKIESYVKMATDGFAIFKTILNFFVSMNVVWMCTWLPFCNHSKGRLYGVLILGFIAETLAILYADSEFLESMDELDVTVTVRFWTRACCFAVWLISCLVSCLYPSQGDTDQYASRMDDLLRSQMEFVSQLNASQTLVAERQAEPDCSDTASVRKYHPVSKRRSRSRSTERRSRSRSAERRSRSKSAEHRSVAISSVVTPYRPPIDRSTLASTSKKAMNRSTVKVLKEMQREHMESSQSSDESSSFSSDESMSVASRTSSKINRKRKYSETLDEPQAIITFNSAKSDDGSVTSESTEPMSDVESKRSKTVC